MADLQAILISFTEKGLGRQTFFGKECIIGRLPECQLQIVDTQVSKRHARIWAQEGKEGSYQIEDLDSLNGVYLNGARIVGPSQISANDVITIGSQNFLFNPDFELLPTEEEERAIILLKDEATCPSGISSMRLETTQVGSLPEEFVVKALGLLAEGKKGLLAEILESLGKWVAFDSAAVIRVHQGQPVDPVCLVGSSTTMTVSKTIASLAISEKKGILVSDAFSDPTFKTGKSIAAGKLRSVLAVPLLLQQEPRGVVFFTKGEPGFYKEADLEFVLHAAPFLVLALSLNSRVGSLQKQLGQHLESIPPPSQICGTSVAIEQVRKTIQKVASAPSTILITGESGTGKELVAQWLHLLSPGAAMPFVAINCGALPENLVESEFFGYEKGAFSGADRAKGGKLELASGGTLFLDEIGELPLHLQAKLLRVLEQKTFYRLGGAKSIRADFRLIAATHRDLRAMVAQGSFREDLFYRIHVVQIQVPPLRDRPEDVEILCEFFLKKFSQELGKNIHGIPPSLLQRLKSYSWPGNIRELKNVIERMVVLSEATELSEEHCPVEDLADVSQPTDSEGSLAVRVASLERQMIVQAMKKAHGKKSAAARLLQISRPTLDKKLADYGVVEPAGDELK